MDTGFGIIKDVGLNFSIERFDNNVAALLNSTFPNSSFSYVIAQKGHYYKGFAHGGANNNYGQMSLDQPVNMASVAKVLTAAALLKAMEDKPYISDLYSIWPYFPESWKKNASSAVKAVTIRDCLQYRLAGLSVSNGGVATGWSPLRDWYTKGTNGKFTLDPAKIGGASAYNNVCVAWLRYVIFYMTAPDWLRDAVGQFDLGFSSEMMALQNELISVYYIGYVRKQLLEPIGITWADMDPLSPYYDKRPLPEREQAQTYYYDYPAKKGYPGWNWTTIGGGGGWFMSVRSLAAFWAHLRYGSLLNVPNTKRFFPYGLSAPATAELMYINFERASAKTGLRIFAKSGAAREDYGVGYESHVVDFENEVQITYMSNHYTLSAGKGKVIDKVLLPAYETAWT